MTTQEVHRIISRTFIAGGNNYITAFVEGIGTMVRNNEGNIVAKIIVDVYHSSIHRECYTITILSPDGQVKQRFVVYVNDRNDLIHYRDIPIIISS